MHGRVEEATPEKTVEVALQQLRKNGKPISKRGVEEITSFTRIQIAGIIGRDYNLQTMFDELRHA